MTMPAALEELAGADNSTTTPRACSPAAIPSARIPGPAVVRPRCSDVTMRTEHTHEGYAVGQRGC